MQGRAFQEKGNASANLRGRQGPNHTGPCRPKGVVWILIQPSWKQFYCFKQRSEMIPVRKALQQSKWKVWMAWTRVAGLQMETGGWVQDILWKQGDMNNGDDKREESKLMLSFLF